MSSSDTLFGPSSELIEVSKFIQTADSLTSESDLWSTTAQLAPGSSRDEWLNLPTSQKDAVEAECRVDDFRSTLNEVISNPHLMQHITKTHEANVYSIHETADTSHRRKRKRNVLADATDAPPDVRTLREKMDAVQLKSWPLGMNAALFIRPPKQADHNTLVNAKKLKMSESDVSRCQALLFVTVYNPVSWGHRLLARSSQHVLLSSQSLGDLHDTIPCTSHEIPREMVPYDNFTSGRNSTQTGNGGAVFCIEDQLYGDGLSEKDYADGYIEYVNALPEKKRPKTSKATSMHDTFLASMTLRLHTPYWLLHVGDCIHYVVFDQIRLLHPTDPPSGDYPLTTQITPPLLDLCRACNKVPAVLSVVGDIRLGESPFVICRPCWNWMGVPKGEETQRVMVIPLPKHEFGWNG